MRDKISIGRVQLLHPKHRENFQKFIEELEETFNITIRVTQGFRSFAEQDKLYAQGRTTAGQVVTHARGGQSFHCYGLAIDAGVIVNGEIDWKYDYSKFAPIAEKYGLTWGHHWGDNDHYENNLGHGPSGWKYFLTLHNAGHVDAAGYVLLDK